MPSNSVIWQTSAVFVLCLASFYLFYYFYFTSVSLSHKSTQPILIIISYDGFRNEYLQRNVTPNLLKFRENGVYADYMMNVFPTKTFTNHHSIATGLYADGHGIPANAVYDEKKRGELKYGFELYHYNPKVLPIWSVNEKIKNGHSGCMMWPGSNFNYSGITCTHTQEYDKRISLMERVDLMINWINDPEKPANLIMFYSEQPDKLAHSEGPESNNVTSMIAELDKLTAYIQDQLTVHDLLNRTNVIHLSDHGMSGVVPAKFINLTEMLDNESVRIYGTSPVLQIVPLPGRLGNVYERLKNASVRNRHFDVYLSEDLPKRWHAYNRQRFGPIVVVAKMNYAFHDMWHWVDDQKTSSGAQFGIHGYDNNETMMHPIFMAKGPSIKSDGRRVKPFATVELFSLFLNLLGLRNADSEFLNKIVEK